MTRIVAVGLVFLFVAACSPTLAAGDEKAPSVGCPIALSKEQEMVLAKVLAEHPKQSCAELATGAFAAFLAEQAKRQAEIERLYRLHEGAVTTPRKPSTP